MTKNQFLNIMIVCGSLVINTNLFAGNNAIQFNGNGGVKVDYDASTNPSEFTFEVWVKLDNPITTQAIISSRDDDVVAANRRGYSLFIVRIDDNTGQIEFQTGTGTSEGWDHWEPANSTITAGVWTHIACVFKGGTKKVYVNGELKDSKSGNYSANTSRPLRIGAVENADGSIDATYFSKGKMDDTRFWNDERTQTEIAANKDIELNGNEAGMVSYFKFNEASIVNSVSGGPSAGFYTGTTETGATATVAADPDLSLPVELASFTASRFGNSITLQWVTESEIENLGFILERSDNGGDWNEIASYKTDATLQGQGSVTYRTSYSFVDNTIQEGVHYNYRLADVSYKGEVEYHTLTSDIELSSGLHPELLQVGNNYPNPFNPSTMITWKQTRLANVQVNVYAVNGQFVKQLVDANYEVGNHSVTWDGTNSNGQRVSAGMYFYKIKSGNTSVMKKMVLVK